MYEEIPDLEKSKDVKAKEDHLDNLQNEHADLREQETQGELIDANSDRLQQLEPEIPLAKDGVEKAQEEQKKFEERLQKQMQVTHLCLNISGHTYL